jgi:probable rRNA maturation factor
MIFIELNPVLSQTMEIELVEKTALEALKHQSIPEPVDLTIVLSDDTQLQQLNLEYLGIDAPTDVLSFPAGETDPETGDLYLGDIIISVPRAALQANAAGHKTEQEVQLLIVHGVLHLLGHDHGELEEKARMWKAQGEILEILGLANIQVKEE